MENHERHEVSSMNDKRVGQRTIALAHPPSVLSYANIGGKFEKEGPLSKHFDELCEDSFFGEKTWEKAGLGRWCNFSELL